jgi:hypothetical protein
MTELPEKSYKHLTDEDLGILLGGYRVIKFKDAPKEFKGVDVPTGLELVYEIQRRLKKSGPNLSWDQTEDRRASAAEPASCNDVAISIPLVLSVGEILDNPDMLIKQFDFLSSGLSFYKTYPEWWPPVQIARSEFTSALNEHVNLFASRHRNPKDYAFYFPAMPNKVLEKINEERAREGGYPKFFFIGLKSERSELLQ